VLDPSDGTLLETETLATNSSSSSGVPVGSVMQSMIYGAVGVVNADGVTPSEQRWFVCTTDLR
jgi:hypothetical protein